MVPTVCSRTLLFSFLLQPNWSLSLRQLDVEANSLLLESPRDLEFNSLIETDRFQCTTIKLQQLSPSVLMKKFKGCEQVDVFRGVTAGTLVGKTWVARTLADTRTWKWWIGQSVIFTKCKDDMCCRLRRRVVFLCCLCFTLLLSAWRVLIFF